MPTNECTRNCWIAGAVLGLFVWILTSGVGTMRWFEGLFLALIAGGLMGAFLVWALCKGRSAGADHGADRNRARASAAGSGGGAGTTVSGGGSPAKATSVAAPAVAAGVAPAAKPVAAPASTTTETSEKPPQEKQADKPSGQTSSSASEAATQSAPETVDAGTTPAAAPASTDSEAGSGATAPAGDGDATKPAARASRAKLADGSDNLKEIKGVGPKLEKMLHDEGVTRFDQIASWSDDDIDRFAAKIGSMGSRIRSDDWVAQAKTLASGAETEFSQRVDKGDVY
ncbi:hypothetical protein MLD63_05060 [Paracoccus sp. TK19116]|uniref:Flap endonuclease-1-like 5' DNA nuclease n=1 Tax=Paracoccus albicereus TaxID=2922394 RepID=A0ABT1MNE1_9RHOB|nr:hypothetical protein [Paracoccus albicereus]MCQ0969797.1 hypothetical protein [Paracoccus albicereus]